MSDILKKTTIDELEKRVCSGMNKDAIECYIEIMSREYDKINKAIHIEKDVSLIYKLQGEIYRIKWVLKQFGVSV